MPTEISRVEGKSMTATEFSISCRRRATTGEFKEDMAEGYIQLDQALTVTVRAERGMPAEVELSFPAERERLVTGVEVDLRKVPIESLYAETLKQLHEQDWLPTVA